MFYHHSLRQHGVITLQDSRLYGLTVAAVQRERYPQFFAVVAAELEAI